MPGDYKKQTKVGDELDIPAAWKNYVTRAADQVMRQSARTAVKHSQQLPPEGLILVKNNSGADRKAFEILGIDTILYGPTDNLNEFKYNYALKGIVPTVAAHSGKFVVCAEPIANNAMGNAFVFGLCPVRIPSTVATAKPRLLDVLDSDATKLTSNPIGSAQVLFVEPSADANGDYWALVRLGVLPTGVWVKLDSVITGSRGVYGCHPSTAPTAKFDPTTDLTSAEVDDGSGTTNSAYLINPGEITTDTGSHWLDPSSYPNVFFCTFHGISTDATGNKPVYKMVDNQTDLCGSGG